jgi:hypothetical protein
VNESIVGLASINKQFKISCYLGHKFHPVSNAMADYTKECYSVLNNKTGHRNQKSQLLAQSF